MAKVYLGNGLVNTSALGSRIVGLQYNNIVATDYLLQENADFLLQEDTDKIIL